MFNYRSRQHGRKLRGQAMVEMALVVIVLLFLTLGLVQFAILANARLTLTNLTRDGGRFAAVTALLPPKPDGTDAETQIKRRVVAQADATPLNNIVESDVTVEYPTTPNNDPPTSGQEVKVTVSCDIKAKKILPVEFPGLAQWGDKIQATASFLIE